MNEDLSLLMAAYGGGNGGQPGGRVVRSAGEKLSFGGAGTGYSPGHGSGQMAVVCCQSLWL